MGTAGCTRGRKEADEGESIYPIIYDHISPSDQREMSLQRVIGRNLI
jgi:hypothetical protein